MGSLAITVDLLVGLLTVPVGGAGRTGRAGAGLELLFKQTLLG